MVLTRKPPAPPAGARVSSTQQSARTPKTRAADIDDLNSPFEDGPSRSSAKSEAAELAKKGGKQKGKAKQKKGQKKQKRESLGFFDLLARAALLWFTIYTLSICPEDDSLKSPVCRGLYHYRRLVLEPYIFPPIQAAFAHPSVAPYVEAVKPHYYQAVATAKPLALRTQSEWKKRVVPQWNKRIVPQWNKRVVPQWRKRAVPRLRLVEKQLAPYLSRVDIEYQTRVAPHLRFALAHLDRWQAQAQPYVLLAAHKSHEGFQRAKPYARPLWEQVKALVRQLLAALAVQRRQFVDPHVAQIWEKMKELSSGTPGTKGAQGTTSVKAKTASASSVLRSASSKVASGTKAAVSSASKIPSSSSVVEKVASSVSSASTAASASVSSVVYTASSAASSAASPVVAKASSAASSASSVAASIAAPAASSVSSAASVASSSASSATNRASASAHSLSDKAKSTASVVGGVAAETASGASLAAGETASAVSVAASDIHHKAAASASSIVSAASSAAASAVIGSDDDDDLAEFYADLGISDDHTPLEEAPEQTEAAPVETPKEETEEEKAARLAAVAEKRANIVARHVKWEDSLAHSVVTQEIKLRAALAGVRSAAAAELEALEDIDVEIEGLVKEGDKLLKGAEGYLKNLAKEKRGASEKTSLWVRVVDKIEEKFTKRLHQTEGLVNAWYMGVVQKEMLEVQEHADVVKGIADAAQADIGLDYVWLDDVTYHDWQRYHDLSRKSANFTQDALMIQNGSHPVALENPVISAIEDLESEVKDVVGGFEMRLRRVKRAGDRTLTGEPSASAGANDAGATENTNAPTVSILPVPGAGSEPGVLHDAPPVVIGRGKQEVLDAMGRVEAGKATEALPPQTNDATKAPENVVGDLAEEAAAEAGKVIPVHPEL